MKIKNFRTNWGLAIGIISFILGYSSIFDSFAKLDIKEESREFKLIKYISNEPICRAKYNEYDENLHNVLIEEKHIISSDIDENDEIGDLLN